ncbi:MAG: methionine--tRNA ligase subunit beta, partial [Rikenellaceae bacterium]|nr:methionine--tRNA ligase subunit beta [Rikenellaceae bacterium]
KPGLLFEKIEDAVIEAQLEKLQRTKTANQAKEAAKIEPQKESVTFDDFSRMDIRVAKVIAAEKVAKTKKLLKLTVDTGIDKRTIVSGIAEYFSAEELVGRQVVVLVNLQPRDLKGIESQGMVLMAEAADGTLSLIGPGGAVEPGVVIR